MVCSILPLVVTVGLTDRETWLATNELTRGESHIGKVCPNSRGRRHAIMHGHAHTTLPDSSSILIASKSEIGEISFDGDFSKILLGSEVQFQLISPTTEK